MVEQKKYMRPVEDFIRDYAEALGVDREVFIENCLISEMARTAVHERLRLPYGFFLQFARQDDEILRGKELFDFLESFYMGELDDSEPSPEEAAAAAERQRERTEQMIQNTAMIKEYQAQGLCPPDFYGPSACAVGYIKQYLDGKIDRPTLDKILSRYKRNGEQGQGKE